MFGECKMMSIQFNGKTVGICFPSSFLRSKRRIPTERGFGNSVLNNVEGIYSSPPPTLERHRECKFFN